ncbi:hypothetical protein BKA67DRAFT_574888 [Truncatella angustata]|uniref:Uncharacterized protein n=1 Tax=Truncatella angustata TaxID=152316 RepID=A0A9P8UEH0_9PEZI|nr:uncharacterized protein BKA67DRAFT_574888 [Truncatella angustata]KAH6648465.1 hypothetical protein BKA67DRAFT_574888 [Truncatella angustata]
MVSGSAPITITSLKPARSSTSVLFVALQLYRLLSALVCLFLWRYRSVHPSKILTPRHPPHLGGTLNKSGSVTASQRRFEVGSQIVAKWSERDKPQWLLTNKMWPKDMQNRYVRKNGPLGRICLLCVPPSSATLSGLNDSRDPAALSVRESETAPLAAERRIKNRRNTELLFFCCCCCCCRPPAPDADDAPDPPRLRLCSSVSPGRLHLEHAAAADLLVRCSSRRSEQAQTTSAGSTSERQRLTRACLASGSRAWRSGSRGRG